VFAFDCLSIDGRTLLREPLTARREALYSALEPAPGQLEFATAKVRGVLEALARGRGMGGQRWGWLGGGWAGGAQAKEGGSSCIAQPGPLGCLWPAPLPTHPPARSRAAAPRRPRETLRS
jgi:hypothetical protein